MALSLPVKRQPLHTRELTMQGYHREDGLLDIEGHLVDTKPFDINNKDRGGVIKTGESLHEMRVRLTVNSNFEIVDAEAVTVWAPFDHCQGGTRSFSNLIGQTIGPGWNRRVKEIVGGIRGCTHITEMLAQIATIVYQSFNSLESPGEPKSDGDGKPEILDTCFGLASNSPVVKREWPKYYRADDESEVS